MTKRQLEDLQNVLEKLTNLSAHLSDISTAVSDNQPYSIVDDQECIDLYVAACDLVSQGEKLLNRFDPTIVIKDASGYIPAAKWMPDMPLRCCPCCTGQGNAHGMTDEDVKRGQHISHWS